MSLYPLAVVPNFDCDRALSAAVSVVLPWSMCPMVPTFTCGFFRSNTPFAMTETSGFDYFRLSICDLRLGVPPPDFQSQIQNRKCYTKLAQGIEPWTSTLPMWRSTAELCQREALARSLA